MMTTHEKKEQMKLKANSRTQEKSDKQTHGKVRHVLDHTRITGLG